MLPLEELEEHDKRNSSIHEAGHAIVALANGIIVEVWLERDLTGDLTKQKTWVGHTRNINGDLKASGGKYIGIAGVVAESFDENPDVTAEEILRDWKNGSGNIPSPSDLELVPDGWDERLDGIRGALKIISKQQKFLQSIVTELVKHSRVSSDRLIVLSAQHSIR